MRVLIEVGAVLVTIALASAVVIAFSVPLKYDFIVGVVAGLIGFKTTRLLRQKSSS